MADDRPPWSLIVWLGVVAGIALGGLAVLILRDRRSGLGGGSPIQIYNGMPYSGSYGGAYGQLVPGGDATPEISMDTKMGSVQLSPDSANKIHYASGKNPWRVDVAVIGPPGTFAYLSTDLSTLHPGFSIASNVAAIPAGADRRIRIQPGQSLYGVSNAPGVMVSVIASQESWPPSVYAESN